MNDIEIARSIKLKEINEIAQQLDIDDKYIEPYGKFKAKISNKIDLKLKNNKNGKLILVTSINPTPLGEGKTTVSIGLADGLRKINRKSILALREPSLGPVFGLKGGATGGGKAQVAPMEDINLHFTGDIHAITSANNLISAVIDNHIYFGNNLGFKRVVWKRCVDLNDRALRNVKIGISYKEKVEPREDGFDISVASEIMAVFCLSKDVKDLKRRIANIIVGYNEKEEPVRISDLKIEGAIIALLKDSINPNLVQTLEHTPAIIHGGPFANIAHGCNSIIATKMGLKLADYVVTEAGFGADLGAEKFLDIKCRVGNLNPSVVVCVATIKALKYHGGVKKEDVFEKNIEALKKGLINLVKHIENIKNKFGLNVIVAINKYKQDIEEEINILKLELEKQNVYVSLVEAWEKGGEGSIDLAKKVVETSEKETKIQYVYELTDSIKEKIEKISINIYGASGVEYTEESLKEIKKVEELGYSDLPICIAKTQYSLSDDEKNLECENPFKIHVKKVILKAGAEFIVVITGNIFTMPGLPRIPAAETIDVDENENIIGIF